MRQDLLASTLFCETVYEDGEALGRVIDKEIIDILSNKNGLSQYNYAAAYSYKNMMIQLSDGLRSSLYERVKKESITLFYIELLLFEESAMGIANDKIVSFLSEIDKYTPRKTLMKINNIMTEHVRTIDFWNIQVNYPSSQKSLDELTKSFNMDEMRAIFQRNKKELLMIYDIRSDIVNKGESSLMSSILMILTVVSVLNYMLNPDNHLSIILTIVGVLIFIILIRKYMQNQMVGKGKGFLSRLKK